MNKITGREQIEKKIRQLISSQDYLSKKIIIGLKESALAEIYDEIYSGYESNNFSNYKEEFEGLGFLNSEGVITKINHPNYNYLSNIEPYSINAVGIDIQALSSQETLEIYFSEIAYISEQQKEPAQLSLF